MMMQIMTNKCVSTKKTSCKEQPSRQSGAGPAGGCTRLDNNLRSAEALVQKPMFSCLINRYMMMVMIKAVYNDNDDDDQR
jgi:hypothetical protein